MKKRTGLHVGTAVKLFLLVALVACSAAKVPAELAEPSEPAEPAGSGCREVNDKTPLAIATAAAQDEYALAVTARSASKTSWGEMGNEAVVLEVSGAHRGFIGHLVLHQGVTKFEYTMHVGALGAGEQVLVRVSPLTAKRAKRAARVCGAQLSRADNEGIAHAPIFRWPAQKAFNDLPMIVGWSASHHAYQTVMTNEDGGTAEICGGGAEGMQAEIARWGRSTDIEAHYDYKATPTWERCTGRVDITAKPLRMEGDHPNLYWGDGHNRVFEDRGGYAHACGSGRASKPDGDFAGWNVDDPSTALDADPGRVIVVRPLPVSLDALGYQHFGGRREALSDQYGPWIYRIASLELERERKIDNARTFPMQRYLYVDVQVAGVTGTGDSYCRRPANGGFVLRAVTKSGTTINSPQITGASAGGGNHDWKRVAIALPDGVGAADIDHFVFDAYNGDGIYVTGLGDAFVPLPEGPNGARLDYVRKGITDYKYYVDDDNSDCTNGVNTGGPGGESYSCVGSYVVLPK